MLQKFLEEGINFNKQNEINKTINYGKWRVGYAAYGLFGSRDSIPTINKETQEKISNLNSFYDSLPKNALTWAANKTKVLEQLQQKVLISSTEEMDISSSDYKI